METYTSFTEEQLENTLARVAERLRAQSGERAQPSEKRLARRRVWPASGENPAGDAAGRFFRAVLAGDAATVKALGQADGPSGGYLAPPGFREEIVADLPKTSELFPHVRAVPVRTDAGHVPSVLADIAVVWGGSDNSAFSEPETPVGRVAWNLKRADLLVKLSRELVADAGASVVEFVTVLLREAIAESRDRMIAAGNGVTEPEGLTVAENIPALDISAALDYGVLVAVERMLPRRFRHNARWLMNGDMLRKVRTLADTMNRPLFLRDGAVDETLLGYPVSESEGLPTGALYFGDLSRYLWFDREEMGVESTSEGGSAFERHQVWVKVWERADGRLAVPEAFVKATGVQ